MKILIVGSGAVASVISKHLAKDPGVTEIICGSKDLERAKEFIDTSCGKIKLVKLDAAEIDEVAKTAKGADLIINASLPRFNENILEAALKAHANYQDLASELADLKTAEQLKFNERFQKERLVGLINTGVAPGIDNLLAKEGADKLDEVETINIRLVEEQQTSEFIFSWSAETALDVLTALPLLYKNNEFVLSKPFGEVEEYEFLQPFGKRHIFTIYGDEVATLPFYIKTKNVDYKSSGTDIEFSKALYRLGLLDKTPIELNGEKIVPLEFFKRIAPKVPTPKEMVKFVKDGVIENAFFALVVEIIGKENGRKIKIKNSAVFPDLKEITAKFPGATYVSYPTGTAAFVFSKAIPKIKNYGVFPPEALDEDIRKDILVELESKGIVISEQFLSASN